MSEKNPFEKNPEHSPTLEDVLSFFKELNLEGCKEVRKIEDEQGLSLYEVITPINSGGYEDEYVYKRKGDLSAATAVYVVYYKNGVPIGGGTSVANYIDGQWVKC